jgi:hypothetical protein
MGDLFRSVTLRTGTPQAPQMMAAFDVCHKS